MSEYAIYASKYLDIENPTNWQDEISSQDGIKIKSIDNSGIVIWCTEEMSNELKEKFPGLKIEYIFPHYRELEKDEK